MDRLESMSIVLAVAEAGSLAAAVRRLNTPPATASRKIAELEEHLRTKLFDRSARRLVLTDAGSSYVAGLKRILADISEIERATSGEYTAPTGELVVTAPVGLGRIHLVPIVGEFLTAYPDITVASSWATVSSTCLKNMSMWRCASACSPTVGSWRSGLAAPLGSCAPAQPIWPCTERGRQSIEELGAKMVFK